MKTKICMLFCALLAVAGSSCANAREKAAPKVYLFKEITPENLVKIYEALGGRPRARWP